MRVYARPFQKGDAGIRDRGLPAFGLAFLPRFRRKIYIIWKGIFAEPKIRGFWGLRFSGTRGIFLGPDSGIPEMRFPWRTGCTLMTLTT